MRRVCSSGWSSSPSATASATPLASAPATAPTSPLAICSRLDVPAPELRPGRTAPIPPLAICSRNSSKSSSVGSGSGQGHLNGRLSVCSQAFPMAAVSLCRSVFASVTWSVVKPSVSLRHASKPSVLLPPICIAMRLFTITGLSLGEGEMPLTAAT